MPDTMDPADVFMQRQPNHLDALVSDREATHGPFEAQAMVSQRLKGVMRSCGPWERLSPQAREALDQIQHKVGRILAGNESHADHWDDIAGYARLCANRRKT